MHHSSLSQYHVLPYCLPPVYVDYIKRLSGVLTAGRPVLLFGSGYQSGQKKKSTNEKYLTMLCQGSLVGGVRGQYTKGGYGKRPCLFFDRQAQSIILCMLNLIPPCLPPPL